VVLAVQGDQQRPGLAPGGGKGGGQPPGSVAGLVENFWAAGYSNVIAGSFLRRYSDYLSFRPLLSPPSAVFLVDLLVDKDVRDHRRITRAKQTTQESRDMADQVIPEIYAY
jgi:hypothetical protein